MINNRPVRSTAYTTGNLPPNHLVSTTAELSVMLGGSETSFMRQLLDLIDKADPVNRYRIKAVYTREVIAYDVWMSISQTPTAAELLDAIHLYLGQSVLPSDAGLWQFAPPDLTDRG